jgi:hypothetical protein
MCTGWDRGAGSSAPLWLALGGLDSEQLLGDFADFLKSGIVRA